MQFRNWVYLAAAVMVTAKPPEVTFTIDQWSPCMQACMRQENHHFNIEHATVEKMCATPGLLGEHAKQTWLAWVRDELEHCLYWRCGMDRDDDEIKDLWAWYWKTCKMQPPPPGV
ncbi:hypothetical protein KCU93_g4371, partial [Aureobasidium melanogenum]